MQEAGGGAVFGTGQRATAVNGARGAAAAAKVDGWLEVDGCRGGPAPARAACQARRRLAASGRR